MNNEKNRGHRSVNYTLVAISVVLYVAALVFFVLPLQDWLDTFFVVSWLFLPAVVGSVLYAVGESRGAFDENQKLP